MGPRYCQKVNVKTGTAKYFDCVAKTPAYFERLYRNIDSWLTEKSYRTRKNSIRIGELESHLKAIRDDFIVALSDLDQHVDAVVDFSSLMKRIEDLRKELGEVRHRFYSDYSSTKKMIM